jgi:hypothetical protein
MALPGMSKSTEGGTKMIDPTDVSPEAVRDLVARISDEEVREMLLDGLDAMAKAANGAWMTIFDAVKRLPILVSSQKRSFTDF